MTDEYLYSILYADVKNGCVGRGNRGFEVGAIWDEPEYESIQHQQNEMDEKADNGITPTAFPT